MTHVQEGVHPICPVMLGDARLAATFARTPFGFTPADVCSEKMLERDIYVIGFSYPVVPKGKVTRACCLASVTPPQARIRVQISAAHSRSDLDRAIGAFTEVGKELKVI